MTNDIAGEECQREDFEIGSSQTYAENSSGQTVLESLDLAIEAIMRERIYIEDKEAVANLRDAVVHLKNVRALLLAQPDIAANDYIDNNANNVHAPEHQWRAEILNVVIM